MPNNLFTYESVGVQRKIVLTRKAKSFNDMPISWEEIPNEKSYL